MLICSENIFIKVPGFEHRISPQEVEDKRSDKPGIRTYGRIIGTILSLFNLAVKLKAFNQDGKEQIFYCYKVSFNEWNLRQETAHPGDEHYDFSSPGVLDQFIKRVKNDNGSKKKATQRREKPLLLPQR